MDKRTVIVKQLRGKACSLYWRYNHNFLCGLGVVEAKLLVYDLNKWIEKNEKKWKRGNHNATK